MGGMKWTQDMSKTYQMINVTPNANHDPIIVSGRTWQEAVSTHTNADVESVTHCGRGIKVFRSNGIVYSIYVA